MEKSTTKRKRLLKKINKCVDVDRITSVGLYKAMVAMRDLLTEMNAELDVYTQLVQNQGAFLAKLKQGLAKYDM